MRLPACRHGQPHGSPNSVHHPEKVANVAHRGASAYAPENTLTAVRQGIVRDADLVELDVQRSRDGELVLCHDRTLARTTNVRQVFPDRKPWRVADFTYRELCRLDAGSWKSATYAGEHIPTLSEAIEVLWPSRAGLLLELKAVDFYPGLVRDVLAELRAVPGYLESAAAANRLCVQSFNWPAIRECKELEPSLPVGLLGRPPQAQLREVATWADLVNPNQHELNAGYVEAVHQTGMRCMVWTVNHPRAMARALRTGVDGVITNRPDELRRVLSERIPVDADPQQRRRLTVR